MTADIGQPMLTSDAVIEHFSRQTRPVVYALVDDEPGDRFLLGVFLSEASARREADAWAGKTHMEMIELEP